MAFPALVEDRERRAESVSAPITSPPPPPAHSSVSREGEREPRGAGADAHARQLAWQRAMEEAGWAPWLGRADHGRAGAGRGRPAALGGREHPLSTAAPEPPRRGQASASPGRALIPSTDSRGEPAPGLDRDVAGVATRAPVADTLARGAATPISGEPMAPAVPGPASDRACPTAQLAVPITPGACTQDGDAREGLALELAPEDHPTAPVFSALRDAPPLRVHAESSPEGLRVWLGADQGEALALARSSVALVQQLDRWAAEVGSRLLAVVCNGRSIFQAADAPVAGRPAGLPFADENAGPFASEDRTPSAVRDDHPEEMP